VTGRLKDMVIRGGENLFPAEIEAALIEHASVTEAAVIGVPDPRMGEEICAWIGLRDGARATEEEIREYCRGKIAHYKVPRYVRFVDEFPMTVTGKAQKFLMREAMIHDLGLARGGAA
jgi:fatty-acyl-CoA synthase